MRQWRGHSLILGRTGSGKTYYVMNSLLPGLGAALFWNGGHELAASFPSAVVHASGSDSVADVRQALVAGRQVVYTPDFRQKVADQELAYWQQELMTWAAPRAVIVDEVARYAPQGSIDTACHILATGGRRWGLECYFITQRVADVSKTIASMCHEWIIFAHSSIDAAYLEQRGVVLSEEEKAVLEQQKHSHFTRRT